MPRRQSDAPGPKSKKHKQKQKQVSYLGDSSSSEEAADAESFHSPDSDPDHTDYGFNYIGASPRTSRRSKEPQPTSKEKPAQKVPRTSQQTSKSRSNTAGQNTPRSSEPIQQVPRSSERISRNSRTIEKNPERRSFLSQTTRNSPRRRKQKTPQQRERNMWNEIRALQKRTDNLTPKAPFARLIRELLIKFSSDATRITLKALEALQLSSEIYLTQLFADSYVCTLHRGRVTLGVHDVRLVRFLRGPQDTGNL